MASIYSKIDECYRLMKKASSINEDEKAYFRNESIISLAYNSNAIEGSSFTYDETRLLLEKGVVTGTHTFMETQDIVGYKKALDEVYARSKEGTLPDEKLIKTLHRLALGSMDSAGEYRSIQNYVGDVVRNVYVPPSPEDVAPMMKEYADRLQKDVIEEKKEVSSGEIDWERLFHSLARHHIEFEKIHPFLDGNGRTGRLLLAYEMIYLGLLPADIRYEDRDRYYAALSSYDKKKRYSTRTDSKTEAMAKLISESELRMMKRWLFVYKSRIDD